MIVVDALKMAAPKTKDMVAAIDTSTPVRKHCSLPQVMKISRMLICQFATSPP